MDICRNLEGLGFVKAGIIKQDDFKFLFICFGEFIQESLKVLRVAQGQFQEKMCSIDRRKSTVEVRGFKAVLKMAKGLYAFCCEGFVRKGQQAKAAFIQGIEVETLKALVVQPLNMVYLLGYFFLNCSTACSSFSTWLLRTTFIFAPYLRLTYLLSV